MSDLDKIKTVVIVMMENRSFDHMLGYLSLPPFNRSTVDGLSTDPDWLSRYTNMDLLSPFQPFLNQNPYSLPDDFDPPHERPYVFRHLGEPQNGVYPMNGFAGAIPDQVSTDPEVRRLVMGYFGADQVPINHFFASHFTICDRWFCSLPAGTQPNRLMAMSGESKIQVNQTPLPEQDLVYDWLNARHIEWRVYHQGIPFFTLMPKWIPDVLFSKRFRPFESLKSDLVNTPPDDQPQVIFVEPTYGDAPHRGRSTDDHAPSGVSDGQEFLMQVYAALTASPTFWRNSLTVITYDEHGGFFDHVSPPLIPTEPPSPGFYKAFESLGVRVPAFVISPFVKPGEVNHALLDHTSILKLLGEKLGGGSYSEVVDNREVESVSKVLSFDNPLNDSPGVPAVDDYLARRLPEPTGATVPEPNTPLRQAFRDSIENMKREGAGSSHEKFGALIQQVQS